MKTLKSILFSIAILALTTVANAKPIGSDKPFTQDYVINTYVAAVTKGNLKDFSKILSYDATFNTVQKNETKNIDKDDVIAGLENNEGIEQECTTTVVKVKETEDAITYEVAMKYTDFTRVDMVTLVGDTDSWKISNVTTSYK